MISKTIYEKYYECDKYLTKLDDMFAHQFYFSFKMNQQIYAIVFY